LSVAKALNPPQAPEPTQIPVAPPTPVGEPPASIVQKPEMPVPIPAAPPIDVKPTFSLSSALSVASKPLPSLPADATS